MATRVLLVDDHAPVRAVLRAILSRRPDVDIVAEAEDGAAAVRLADELAPDVVLMDLQMPRLNGIEATRRILSANPLAKVIAVSMHAERELIDEILAAGAHAYVLKSRAASQLARALEAVRQNRVYLSPNLSGAATPPSREPDTTRRTP